MWIPASDLFFFMLPQAHRRFIGLLVDLGPHVETESLRRALTSLLSATPMLRARSRWRGLWIGFLPSAASAEELITVRVIEDDADVVDHVAGELERDGDELFRATIFEQGTGRFLLISVNHGLTDFGGLLFIAEALGTTISGAPAPTLDARRWLLRTMFKLPKAFEVMRNAKNREFPRATVPRRGPLQTAWLSRRIDVEESRDKVGRWRGPHLLRSAVQATESPESVWVLWQNDSRFAFDPVESARIANFPSGWWGRFSPAENAEALLKAASELIERTLRAAPAYDGWGRAATLLIPHRLVGPIVKKMQSETHTNAMYVSWGGTIDASLATWPVRPRSAVAFPTAPPMCDLPSVFAIEQQHQVTISFCYDPGLMTREAAEAFATRVVERMRSA